MKRLSGLYSYFVQTRRGLRAESQPLLMLSSASPVFGNNPSFAVIGFGDDPHGEPGLTIKPRELVGYYANLDERAMVANEPPTFSKLYNTSTPLYLTFGNVAPPWLTNAAYADRAARMQDLFPTPEGEAAWALFHRDVAANGNMTSDRSCSGFALDEMKGDCKTCSGGCRVAWICLLRHGLSRAEYEACLGRLAKGLTVGSAIGLAKSASLPERASRAVSGTNPVEANTLSQTATRTAPSRWQQIELLRSKVEPQRRARRFAQRWVQGYRPAHGPTADLFG